ncbi:hypothetical protein E4M02_02425 [Brevundimonas sp. S30B]|uniref:threonine/serine exporter family protein n=1 Tax=unclassified Brevundimonas TaxID=2622653 RepID=UPI001103D038|nr:MULTISPECIES: threonine/serine exporter family protein [unclassified Brevundimonas]TFW03953.1 hypothetical protein E4M02_02425 [Brevundimonas sp. S30B]
MTFELSPLPPSDPKTQPPKPSIGPVLLTLLLILCIGGIVGWFFDGRDLGAFVGGFMITGLIVSVLGALVRLPFFFNKRLVAIGAGLVTLLAGVPFAMSLEAPERTLKREAKATVAKAESRGTYDDVHRKPERYLVMRPVYGREFGRVSIGGTLSNSSPYAIKDVKLKCRAVSETNKTLARHRLTIFKRVPAGETITFAPVEVGYVDPQVVEVYCEVSGADMIPGPAKVSTTAG